MFLFSVVLQAQVDVEKAINEARQKKGNEVLLVDSTMMRSIQVMQHDGKLNNYKKYSKVELRNAFQKYGFYDYDYEFVQLTGTEKKSFDINRKAIFNKSLRSAIKKAEYNSISYVASDDGQVVNVLVSKKTIMLEEPSLLVNINGAAMIQIDQPPYYKHIPSNKKDSCFVIIRGFYLDGDIDDLRVESNQMEILKYGTGKATFGKKMKKDSNYFEFLLYSETVEVPEKIKFSNRKGEIKAEFLTPYVDQETRKFVYMNSLND